jgi:hypothetical protein
MGVSRAAMDARSIVVVTTDRRSDPPIDTAHARKRQASFAWRSSSATRRRNIGRAIGSSHQRSCSMATAAPNVSPTQPSCAASCDISSNERVVKLSVRSNGAGPTSPAPYRRASEKQSVACRISSSDARWLSRTRSGGAPTDSIRRLQRANAAIDACSSRASSSHAFASIDRVTSSSGSATASVNDVCQSDRDVTFAVLKCAPTRNGRLGVGTPPPGPLVIVELVVDDEVDVLVDVLVDAVTDCETVVVPIAGAPPVPSVGSPVRPIGSQVELRAPAMSAKSCCSLALRNVVLPRQRSFSSTRRDCRSELWSIDDSFLDKISH